MQAPAQLTYSVLKGHLHMVEENSTQGKRSDQYHKALAKLEQAERELLVWGQTVINQEFAIETLDSEARQQIVDRLMKIR